MRYSTALIAFLWSIASVVKPQIVGELNLQNFELPEAIMLYDIIILRKNTQPNIGFRFMNFIHPRTGICEGFPDVQTECRPYGPFNARRRKYFFTVTDVDLGQGVLSIEMLSNDLHNHVYSATGTVTVQCDEDVCRSTDRFFLPVQTISQGDVLGSGRNIR